MTEDLRPSALLELVGTDCESLVEAFTEGFALFDSDECLTLCNSRFLGLMAPGSRNGIRPGLRLVEALRGLLDKGQTDPSGGKSEAWLAAERLRHGAPGQRHVQRCKDGSTISFRTERLADGGMAVLCSDITTGRDAGAERLRGPPVLKTARVETTSAFWEEDWSDVKSAVDEIRRSGVTDLGAFFLANPSTTLGILRRVRFPGFDDAAVDLYRADSRVELERFLAPAPDSAFVAYPLAVAALAGGKHQVEFATSDRAVDGNHLRLIETFQLPSSSTSDWSCILSSSRPIAGSHDEPATPGRGRLHRAQSSLPTAYLSSVHTRTVVSMPVGPATSAWRIEDQVALLPGAVCVVDASARLIGSNAAAKRMLAAGIPIQNARGKLSLGDRTASKRLREAIGRATGDVQSDGNPRGELVAVHLEGGAPRVLRVIQADHLLKVPDPSDRKAAAIQISGEPSGGSAGEAIACLFGLTRAETRVTEGIIGGRPLKEVARDMGIAPATAKTHLLRVFRKTGSHRQVDLIRLAASLELPAAAATRT
ncbi:MAG: PAS-domain containing protein [Paracoccaceae bacterium]